MMSKHLFFKAMKEDLCHRIWMIALSALGSFLMVMVVWLIWRSNQGAPGRIDDGIVFGGFDERRYRIEETITFFREYVSAMGGILAVAGALVAGLSGFRYVFHKNMVDAYHSLPIRRSTLFGACFLNGFLIWLLPFAAFLLPTAGLAGGFIRALGGTGADIGEMICAALGSLAVLTVVFLLVYGLTLVAVMLCGNLLNTLVCMGILGFGAIIAVGIGYAFFGMYMESFYDAWDWSASGHAAPLFEAFALIFWRVDRGNGQGALAGKLAIDCLLAIALSWGAWRLYCRRASELAEQGMKNKAVTALLRIVVGVVAGMCGWMLFILLAGNYTVFWGIFGAVLGAGVSVCILNIIFAMDFKAFFTHKRQLGLILAATLLICFAFQWDWFGYDSYLPKKESLREIGLYVGAFSNRYLSTSSENNPLEQMCFQDTDAIYAYLERMTEESGEEVRGEWYSVVAKVKLGSGRSYYRRYRVDEEDLDVLWPLVTSEEYLIYAFCVSEDMMERCESFSLYRGGEEEEIQTRDIGTEAFADILRAYNQDVLENPAGTFDGDGRLVTKMNLKIREDTGNIHVSITVCETMDHTMEAMRSAGLGEWVEVPEIEEIAAVTLGLYSSLEKASAAERIAAARSFYGVDKPEGALEEPEEAYTESAEAMVDRESVWVPTVEVTEQAEIEELYPMLSYAEPERSDKMFREGFVRISYTDREGNERDCYLPKGVLPEKYILRFGKYS